VSTPSLGIDSSSPQCQLPLQMIGRPILKKQTNYSLYRPSAVAVANTLASMPFSATKIFLFNIVVYFLTGLHRSAGAFWTFHLFSYLAYLAIQGLFRTLGLFCFSFESAFRVATFYIPNLCVHILILQATLILP